MWAKKIFSYDISPLCTKERIVKTIEMYKVWNNNNLLSTYLPEIDTKRWELLTNIDLTQSFESLLNDLHLDINISDVSKTNHNNESLDYIVSNNVLEHIYPKFLNPILNEFFRILKNDGLQSHFIDMSDHFAHNDNSISIYNYLKFSDFQWKLIDNTVQPQNRLRINDYVKMFENKHSNVRLHRVRKGDVNQLKKMKLSKIYSNLDDAAISHAHLIASN